jgi:hypothetical protein
LKNKQNVNGKITFVQQNILQMDVNFYLLALLAIVIVIFLFARQQGGNRLQGFDNEQFVPRELYTATNTRLENHPGTTDLPPRTIPPDAEVRSRAVANQIQNGV